MDLLGMKTLAGLMRLAQCCSDVERQGNLTFNFLVLPQRDAVEGPLVRPSVSSPSPVSLLVPPGLSDDVGKRNVR